jgi:hypothetical protein
MFEEKLLSLHIQDSTVRDATAASTSEVHTDYAGNDGIKLNKKF